MSDALPGEEEHEFRTAAGMVMAALGHMPQTGEVFAWRGIRFEVVDLDGARIDKLLVTPAPSRGIVGRGAGYGAAYVAGATSARKGKHSRPCQRKLRAERRAGRPESPHPARDAVRHGSLLP